MTAAAVAVAVGAAVAVAVAVGVAARLVDVHRSTWDWTLRPQAASTKVELGGRDYVRSGPAWPAPVDLSVVGRTRGGGDVLVEGAPPAGTATVIYVRDQRRLWSYSLLGGP